jgi:hypothetical protein
MLCRYSKTNQSFIIQPKPSHHTLNIMSFPRMLLSEYVPQPPRAYILVFVGRLSYSSLPNIFSMKLCVFGPGQVDFV